MVLLLTLTAAAAAADGWVSHGPFCARPSGLAAGGSLGAPAYLAVGGSLFRSRNGWATWSRVGAELPVSFLSAVAVAPQNPQLVYFAIWDGAGVFRSSDGGETWTPVFRGLPDPLVQDLTVPAGPAGTVFAIAPYCGIYRSRDRGETWTDVSPPETAPSNFFALLAHPLHPERLAAQTLHGLWRSADGGTTWKPWNAGLPLGSTGDGLSGLTLAPGDVDIAFVTLYQTLYRSQGGQPWKKIGRVPVNSFAFVNALVAGPGATPVLLVGQNGDFPTTPGVLRSRDGGRTWQPLSLRGETVYRLSYLPALGRVVALTGRGAFQSSDLGTTWKRTGDGVAASRVTALASADATGKILVAGLQDCLGGIAHSADRGQTWQIEEIRAPGVRTGATDVDVLASAPSMPLRMYAGVMDDVLRSNDGGVTWAHSSFNDGIGGGHSAAIAVHPTNPNLVFIAGQHGLSQSRDGGRTWRGGLHDYPFNEMSAVAFDAGQPQRMLAASWYGGLFRSTDTGATWKPIAGTDFLRVGVLAIDPHDSRVVLAAALFDDVRVSRSADGGATWAPSDIGIEGRILGLAFAADGAAVVAGGDGGIFKSRDGGQTWQKIDDGPASARAILLQRNGILRVGTNAGVVSSPSAVTP